MDYVDDIDELKAKHICCQCVGERYLSEEVESNGTIAECSYCGQTAKYYSIDDMAELFE
jgi:hypothetical protein